MSFDLETIYNLLPAVHRIRDAEQGGPLKALLSVIADEAAVIEEDLAGLHDDLFVETASEWALPYIGDLVGVRGVQGMGAAALAPRAEVANAIAYRRRKGTAAMLETLAHDLTGLPARAVEFFQLLATTQYMNHIRPRNRSVISVRNARRLEFLGTPFEHLTGLEYPVNGKEWIEYPGTAAEHAKRFDDLTHTADVRRIASGRGRYNIPNVGIFLWRLRAYPLTLSPAVAAAAGDNQRFFLNPLGCNTQLFNLPVTEDDFTHLAEPINVPIEITRRMMAAAFDDFYGEGRAVCVYVGVDDDGNPVPVAPDRFTVCDLRDVDPSVPVSPWAHTPVVDAAGDPDPGRIAIDPVLGRIAFAREQTLPVLVSYHYGFSANIGGGEYSRGSAATGITGPEQKITSPPNARDASLTVIDHALGAVATSGKVTVAYSGRFEEAEPWTIDATGKMLELRAADKCRPTIVLNDELLIMGGDTDDVTLDGFLLARTGIRVRGVVKIVDGEPRIVGLRRLRLRHCTLVPGRAHRPNGDPAQPGLPSLIVESPGTIVEIESCIIGGIRAHRDVRVEITNSIVDATAASRVAYGGLDPETPRDAFGGALRVEKSTIIGRVYADAIDLASNTIFLASLEGLDAAERAIWKGPVQARRRQEGCVRFSFVPAGSRTARRYYCRPMNAEEEARMHPMFSSLRYAEARYCQLSTRSPAEIRTGADDESEMGAFHDLFLPQRESYLRSRLDEYLRFGLEAGIFYAT